MLEEWGWSGRYDAGGDVIGLEFDREKLGDEEMLFGALVPFVAPGGYIEMVGEDGDIWRWVFDGGTVSRVEPTLVWG